MAALYGVDRRIEKVEPFEPLKIDCKFDCVTAVATVFDRYHGKGGNIPASWGASEWLFFLQDIETRLTPGAKVLLWMNRTTHCQRP